MNGFDEDTDEVHTWVIYHAQCKDGFASAWAHYLSVPQSEKKYYKYFPAQHGERPPLLQMNDKHIIMLDFVYEHTDEYPGMRLVQNVAKSLLVLDHHKTARDRLTNFKTKPSTQITFDMDRSGAGMTWDYFHPSRSRPWIINYVEDRDLWRNALPSTRELNAYISTIPFEFNAWSDAAFFSEDENDYITAGKAILAKTKQYIREVSTNSFRIRFEGYDVPIINAPHYDISELLQFLCNNETFAVGWYQLSNGRIKYSLRSKGFDVAKIAEKYGGGGHPTAAGFETDEPIHFNLRVKA